MAANGSPEPLFESDEGRCSFVIRLPVHALAQEAIPVVSDQVTMEVSTLLKAVNGEMSRQAMQTVLGLKNADHFRKAYVLPAMAAGCLEMTLPEQPKSRLQRYRLTEKGRRWLLANASNSGVFDG